MGLVEYGSSDSEEGHEDAQPSRSGGLTGRLPAPKRRQPDRKQHESHKRIEVSLDQLNEHEKDTSGIAETRAPSGSRTGLSSLLPAPKRPSASGPIPAEKQHDNATTDEPKLEREPGPDGDTVKQTAFVPHSVAKKVAFKSAMKPRKPNTTQAAKTPLFSVGETSISPPTRNDDAPSNGSYKPLLATRRDLGVSRHAVSQKTEQKLESPVHPSEMFRYDSSQYANGADDTASSEAQRPANGTGLDGIPDEVFGRREKRQRAGPVKYIEVNAQEEYEHNERLRASGVQEHQPVRSIAPGRHQLSGLLNMAATQKDQFEEYFARNRQAKKESGSKYGF